MTVFHYGQFHTSGFENMFGDQGLCNGAMVELFRLLEADHGTSDLLVADGGGSWPEALFVQLQSCLNLAVLCVPDDSSATA